MQVSSSRITEHRGRDRGGGIAPHFRIYVSARQPGEAIRHLDEALQLSPMLDLAHLQRGHALLQKGMYDEALAAMQRATELGGGRDAPHLAYAHALAGDTSTARRMLADSCQRQRGKPNHSA